MGNNVWDNREKLSGKESIEKFDGCYPNLDRQQRSQQQHSTLYNYADGNEDNYLDLDSDLEDFESSP